VGDIRSRLVRLIPNHEGDEERTALKTLFEYRLCRDPLKARAEWLDIVEARHLLWTFISSPKRELIRSVLNTLNLEIVKRTRPTSSFSFAEASIGNMFLTGYVLFTWRVLSTTLPAEARGGQSADGVLRARIFSGSFESAIYLLAMICSIPPSISVLPAINSNFTHHISAGLRNGIQITGQVAISHPSAPTALPDDHSSLSHPIPGFDYNNEDANLPGSLPALRRQHIAFSKEDDDNEDLPARIERVWYINPYGHEIWPVANPKVIDAIRQSRTVIYSIGSLYTSIIPSIILRGVGQAIADQSVRQRVLILNSKNDRETGPKKEALTARDFVEAIARAAGDGEKGEVKRFVSHLVYLEGKGVPKVDAEELEREGIRCVKVAGRWGGEGRGRGLRYDEVELTRALEEIVDED
jgi:2-phospho-L-lactate transferase/gluconeogenesis factor (CofD/UPF0052 family)